MDMLDQAHKPTPAPIPPHVAASEGPIKIHTPKQEATIDAVKDLDRMERPAFKYEEIDFSFLENTKPKITKNRQIPNKIKLYKSKITSPPYLKIFT